MDTLGKISGIDELNLSLMKSIFQQVINGMEAKEKELIAKEESSVFRMKQAQKLEREINLLLEKGFEQMEMRKKKFGLMLEDVVIRQEKMNGQERRILGLFERIEFQGKQLLDMKKVCDEEMVRHFEEWEKKARDLDEKQEKLERFAKEMDMKERVLGLKEKGLLTKEKELDAKEELWKFRKKYNEIDQEINPQQESNRDLDLANQSKYAGKRKNFRAREEESPQQFHKL